MGLLLFLKRGGGGITSVIPYLRQIIIRTSAKDPAAQELTMSRIQAQPGPSTGIGTPESDKDPATPLADHDPLKTKES